jgi:uncharacterized protein (TIGR02301 family)
MGAEVLSMLRRLLVAALASALVATPVAAQGPFPFFPFFRLPRREAPPPPADLAPARPALPRAAQPKAALPGVDEKRRPEGAPPPYEPDMNKLAEILGALHYLHPLCGVAAGTRWRGEMEGLIESEQPGPERRGRLIASFNRGYFTYEQTYRSCTPAASLAIERFVDEGARLSRDIATRYAY